MNRRDFLAAVSAHALGVAAATPGDSYADTAAFGRSTPSSGTRPGVVDGRTLEPGARLHADICVVGSGPVGVAAALELAEKYDVIVLESGGEAFDCGIQELNAGEQTGTRSTPLDQSRVRVFGGTSSVWGGGSSPFVEEDFQHRPWVPNSGWPISLKHLDYERAAKFLGIHFDGSSQKVGSFLEAKEHIRAINIATQYRPLLARTVRTLLWTTVTAISMDGDSRLVRGINAVTANNKKIFVSCAVLILAAGGIENSRLLLNARHARSRFSQVSKRDPLGGYFMQHIYLPVGTMGLRETGEAAFKQRGIGADEAARNIFRVAPSTAAAERIGLALFKVVRVQPGRDSEAYARLRAYLSGEKYRCTETTVWEALQELLPESGKLAPVVLRALLRVPGVPTAFIMAEQQPRLDSRVRLGEKLDRFGVPRVNLELSLSDEDRRSVRRAAELFSRYVGSKALGVVRSVIPEEDPTWPKELLAGSHQLGGTRMHVDPRLGVVDSECRVHDFANLYVSGSSVFPTAGSGSPTLTAVALAQRLSDRLKVMRNLHRDAVPEIRYGYNVD